MPDFNDYNSLFLYNVMALFHEYSFDSIQTLNNDMFSLFYWTVRKNTKCHCEDKDEKEKCLDSGDLNLIYTLE